MSAPLEGILVVSLEQAVAAPLCTARLADAGARVIKVEREGGDFARGYDRACYGESAFFVWLNRGKESVELNLKAPGDAALLQRILARADVFVQNLAPGAAARLGLGHEVLRARYPRLVTCDMSGYGEEGPYRDMRAYDMLVQAESGLVSVSGTPEVPGRIGVSACDIGTGLNAHTGILQALLQRERTGEGAALSVSMFDSMADWMAPALLVYDYEHRILPRTGLAHPLIAPYGAYAVADGSMLLVAVQNDREWQRFAEIVLGQPEVAERPEFRTNQQRVENRAALNAVVAPILAALERAELETRMRAAQLAFGAVNDTAGLSRHPALRRMAVETVGGPVAMPATPVRFRGTDPAPGPVPALGAHTAAVRAEFGEG